MRGVITKFFRVEHEHETFNATSSISLTPSNLPSGSSYQRLSLLYLFLHNPTITPATHRNRRVQFPGGSASSGQSAAKGRTAAPGNFSQHHKKGRLQLWLRMKGDGHVHGTNRAEPPSDSTGRGPRQTGSGRR